MTAHGLAPSILFLTLMSIMAKETKLIVSSPADALSLL
jgi:hypothetical protein